MVRLRFSRAPHTSRRCPFDSGPSYSIAVHFSCSVYSLMRTVQVIHLITPSPSRLRPLRFYLLPPDGIYSRELCSILPGSPIQLHSHPSTDPFVDGSPLRLVDSSCCLPQRSSGRLGPGSRLRVGPLCRRVLFSCPAWCVIPSHSPQFPPIFPVRSLRIEPICTRDLQVPRGTRT
ncbi:hypothetical protein FB451DRAFT_1308364 [Mycena latifolia]|nr:hypothetical protein FB451DRAFT_1308364 [Mycena latifolia]